ncbi:hypothetical protein IJ750_02290 [bacterium]|nr:hypothetical protein [bacterium]
MKSFSRKLPTFILSASLIVVAGGLWLYKYVVPAVVSNDMFINYIQEQASKALGAEVKIIEPELRTGVDVAFTVNSIEVNKDGKNLLLLNNIDTLFSLKEIFAKRIIVKKMVADKIYADIDDIMAIAPKEKKEKSPKSPIILDFYNVLLGVKDCTIIYNNPAFDLDFKARHMIFDRTNERKYLHFDFDFELKKDSHKIAVSANDMNRIFMENKTAYIKDFPITIDKSSILINAFLKRKGGYELNISAKDFSASDIADIVRSNIVVANGRQMLEPIGNVKGSVDFNLKLAKNVTDGKIKVNNVTFDVIPLLNIPITVTQGNVEIGNKDIEYKDFEGFYNKKAENKFKLKGYTKDYQKTCDTKITSGVFVTNDFFKNYLSKMLNSPIELVGNAGSMLILTSKNGSCDILWYFLLKENQGFKFGKQKMVLKDYKTMFKADLSIIKNILKINTINYYITQELKKGMTPLVSIKGNIDMSDNMKLLDLNLDMPHPLPSEFLNFLACQRIFKKGEVSGKMSINNRGKVPTMEGEFALDKVLIPAQRVFIKNAKLTAKGGLIDVKADGRFRRSSYKFNGKVLNELKFPIIAKDVILTVDDVDVEKILTQPQLPEGEQPPQPTLVSTGAENEENMELPAFPKGLIVLEKCSLNLIKGVYKEINFGNLHADMTLDKNGVMNLKSNKFDIAEGTSALKINADLYERNYYLRLGIKDVNSDIMATSILGLPRQISGKAMGLIELNTDKSLKLNGDIKFKIHNGTIGQVGYVEYILKVASLFRNPLAMISPSTVVDLVSIPDGRFEEIQGEMKLKDNVIERMKIMSSADELATFIIGRYDLTYNDAMLRVYTKFSNKGKGLAGALRNISLNSLASKISISSRNDSNYYARELEQIPKLKTGEDKAQVFLTKVDGDILNFNFLSSLKRIK